MLRRGAALTTLTAMALSLVSGPALPARAAAPDLCRGHDYLIFQQIVPAGGSTYVLYHREVRYKNCTRSAKRVRPDIAFLADPSCRSVAPGATQSWPWQYSSRAFPAPSFRAIKSC